MDILWNLGVGLLVAAVIPLLVPIRHGSAPVLLVLGVSGALAVARVGRWIGLVEHTSSVLGLVLSSLGALLALIVYGIIGKRWPERGTPEAARGRETIHIQLTR